MEHKPRLARAASCLLLLLSALVIGGIVFFGIFAPIGESFCDWSLSAQAWVDANANGVWDEGELPLENVMLSQPEAERPLELIWPIGTNAEGFADLHTDGFGSCPRRLVIAAQAPEGYEPTTPARVEARPQEGEATISFGFRYTPGVTPTPRLSVALDCEQRSFPTGILTDVEFAPNGDIWATNEGSHHGISVLREDREIIYGKDEGATPTASGIALAPDGTVWVAELLGILSFDGTTWKRYREEDGLLSNDTLDVAVTPDGHVWTATYVGLSELDPATGTWHHYTDLGNLGQTYYARLILAPDSTLWLVTSSALYRFDRSVPPGQPARPVAVPLPTAATSVAGASFAPDGTLWVAGETDGEPLVAQYLPASQEWTLYTYETTRGAMLLDSFTSIAALPDGSVIVGAQEWAALRLTPGSDGTAASGRWERLTFPGYDMEQEYTSVENQFVEPGGAVWLITSFAGDLRCSTGN